MIWYLVNLKLQFFNTIYKPPSSPPKERPFEKYKPMALFSGIYGIFLQIKTDFFNAYVWQLPPLP